MVEADDVILPIALNDEMLFAACNYQEQAPHKVVPVACRHSRSTQKCGSSSQVAHVNEVFPCNCSWGGCGAIAQHEIFLSGGQSLLHLQLCLVMLKQ